MPELALNLSRGCGNPTGFAGLAPGDVVVDFGCGGGIDVILAAQKTGSKGRVVGIDFTYQMIECARQAVAEAGLEDRDIDLRVASMEESRLLDKSADVVMSNCVVNLCPDKEAVYKEAFRILRAGGRLAVSDIILTENIGAEVRERFQSTWTGCFGGAVLEADYWRTVRKAGFAEVRVVARHILAPEELGAMARCPGEEYNPAPAKEDLARAQGKAASIKFTAVKPSSG
ncbi:MAG: methyltransferase domain-containing protein [Nitrospinota bacterium]|nr:methyltransferase domain-containing protein [Nitrospinota bacterium]